MPHRRRETLVAAAWIAAGLIVGCGDSPTTPSAGVPDPGLPLAALPRATSVSIEGPEVVPLGEVRQFRLTAQMSDGSRRDVTEQAEWFPPLGEVATVDGPGLVMGRQGGQTHLHARFEPWEGFKFVIVLPAGTHRLTGHVRETDGGVPVADARVEVARGIGTGLSTLTDYWGAYALFGVAGDTSLRIIKDGYRTGAADLLVTANQSHDLGLAARRPHPDLSGVYTLTLSAASQCGRGFGPQVLPEEAGTRTYAAVVEQRLGASLSVDLTTASGDRISFHGRVEPARAAFELAAPSHSEEPYGFADRLSDSRTLTIDGRVWVPLSSARLEGNLDGRFSVLEEGRVIASCASENHRFLLAR